MHITAVLRVFKTKSNFARCMGVSKATVSSWGDTIPPLRSLQVEKITKGVLTSDFRFEDLIRAICPS